MTQNRSKKDREFDERWEQAKKVKTKKSASVGKNTSVFSIKIDRELLRLLVERARDLGVGPSTLARSLIEEGLLSAGVKISDEALIETLQVRLKEAAKS